MLKMITIIGARPQFVKAAVVSRAIAAHNRRRPSEALEELIVHTGQHFDPNMSDVFFEQMQIPKPDFQLGVKELSHGAMTGRMLEKIESVLVAEKPDLVLVYGDTNSTLAGALAAVKLHIPAAHVEAGLRSFNMRMPEEVNRVLTDHVSSLLFCPTTTALANLKAEGLGRIGSSPVVAGDKGAALFGRPPQVFDVGDVMMDAALFYQQYAAEPEFALPDSFVLATVHRPENTDDPRRLRGIFAALADIGREMTVVLPLHPRTRKILQKEGLAFPAQGVRIVDPVGYLQMVFLLQRCFLVMTDSGGLQKEAFYFRKPCVTLRDETEWTELVDGGFNRTAGADEARIRQAFEAMAAAQPDFDRKLYGDGTAGRKIVAVLKDLFVRKAKQ